MRAWRNVIAVTAAVAGVVDLAAAAAARPPRRHSIGPELLGSASGAKYGLLVLGLLLVGLAVPLHRGKRVAWGSALAAAVASVVLAHLNRHDTITFLVAVALVVLLVAGRRAFQVVSDPLRARAGVVVLLGGLGLVLVYAVAGLYLLDAEFRRSTTLGDSAEDALRLLFLLPPSVVEPATHHGAFFLESVRVAVVVVVLVSVALLVATAVLRQGQDPADRADVQRILEGYATTSLAPFQLLDDKRWCFSPDRQAFVGYAMVGRVAVALGEPIGATGSQADAARAFLDRCERHGWIPVFHQVSEPGRDLLGALGLRSLKIGEEAVVDVVDPAWPKDKSMRSALRRVERAGLRVTELPQPIDDRTLAELRAVSDAWMADGGHRERRFTLGRFDPEYLRSTPILALVDGEGRVVAFANVVPSYQSTNGNFDLMRRSPDAPNGVMEALFVALMQRFAAEGRQGMTLGFAPLTGIEGDQVGDRLLRALNERGNRFFNFDGLRRFKEKWKPWWEPRFLVYRADTELLHAASAVARVGELPDERGVWGRVVALARRLPFSIALLGTVLWLMVATRVDHGLYPVLDRIFALGWHDLLHLQLWRLPTSELVQTRPGLVLSNVLLLFLAVPVAEWRLGSKLTVVLFFLGDWVSTVPTIVGARLLGALTGNESVLAAALGRDSGSSSGAWAVALGVTWSLRRGRLRTGLLVLEVGFLLAALAVYHREFDVQHLISAMAGIAIVEVWQRWARRRAHGEPGRDPERVAAAA